MECDYRPLDVERFRSRDAVRRCARQTSHSWTQDGPPRFRQLLEAFGAAHWSALPGEHVVQRLSRADRLHSARRRARVLRVRARRARPRSLRPDQVVGSAGRRHCQRVHMSDKYILGISAFYHDSAACLLRDGEIVAAAQEERFTRKKGDSSFPHRAVEFCLKRGRHHASATSRLRRLLRQAAAEVRADSRDLSRRRAAGLHVVPDGRPALDQGQAVHRSADQARSSATTATILYAEHHESHAASAFFPSPVRGGRDPDDRRRRRVGDGVDRRRPRQRHRDPRRAALARLARPAVLGVHLLHRVQGQLRRVQGHGARAVRRAEVRRPDLQGADRPARGRLVPAEPEVLQLPHRPDDDQRRRSTSCSAARRASPRASSRSARWISRDPSRWCARRSCCAWRGPRTRRPALENLCLAGGVALNCVGNGRLLREGPFKRIWIQPAAGDAGGALGVAQLIWHRHFGQPRDRRARQATR